MIEEVDKIIIGAGIYGVYAALYLAKKEPKSRILIIECEKEALLRATYANQARVHMGYHYPRSFSTAKKTSDYFYRFVEEFGFCINKSFDQIYAISSRFSWTNARQFERFCESVKIPCRKVDPAKYFSDAMVEGAYLTKEYTYDAGQLRTYLAAKILSYKNVEILYSVHPVAAEINDEFYYITLSNGSLYKTRFIINATYSSTNILNKLFGCDTFKVKYELCEVILCNLSRPGENTVECGFTVMDGPFFSIMPFGNTGMHSLTSVTFTPHKISYDVVPKFKCMEKEGALCKEDFLANCNDCQFHQESAWRYMHGLAKKYLRNDYEIQFIDSVFSIKPILSNTEIDDSRPTVIKILNEKPMFLSVLSGKVSTIYDLEEALSNVKAK